MKKHIESLIESSAKPLGTILYIGAGSGADVSRLISLNPKKLTAIEPTRELFDSLKKRLKQYAFVELRNTWIFPNIVASENVRCFNNPRFNSIKSEKSLEVRNISLVKESFVTGESLFSLLSDSELKLELTNVLVIDTLEPSILLKDIYSEPNLIEALDFIILKSTRLSEITTVTNSDSEFNKYFLRVRVNEPSLNIFLLNRNFILKKSRAEVAELKVKVTEVKSNFSEYIQKNKNEVKELLDKVASLKCLLSEKDQKITILSENRDSLESCLNEKEIELKSLTQSKGQLTKDKEGQIEALAEKLKKSEDLQAMSALSSNLNSKLNLKLQSDISNLREKYMEKVDEEKRLTSLVTMLYEKLKIAERYFHEFKAKESRYILGKKDE